MNEYEDVASSTKGYVIQLEKMIDFLTQTMCHITDDARKYGPEGTRGVETFKRQSAYGVRKCRKALEKIGVNPDVTDSRPRFYSARNNNEQH